MTDKERIKQYLDYKRISKNKFCTQTGLSIGFLDSGKSLGLDKARIIINTYQDMSLEWLVMGTGPMLRSQEGAVPTKSTTAPAEKTDDKLLTLIEKQASKIEAQAIEIGRLKEHISLITNNIHHITGGEIRSQRSIARVVPPLKTPPPKPIRMCPSHNSAYRKLSIPARKAFRIFTPLSARSLHV